MKDLGPLPFMIQHLVFCPSAAFHSEWFCEIKEMQYCFPNQRETLYKLCPLMATLSLDVADAFPVISVLH